MLRFERLLLGSLGCGSPLSILRCSRSTLLLLRISVSSSERPNSFVVSRRLASSA